LRGTIEDMALRFAHAVPTIGDDLRYEPRPQRLRIHHDGQPVADTTKAFLIWEPRRVVPLYAVPWDDFSATLAKAEHVAPDLEALPRFLHPGGFANHSTPGHVVDLTVGDQTLSGTGFVPDDSDIGGRVLLDFDPFTWLEEEEPVIGHPHDPFKRIDVLPSSRHVQVFFDDVLLADSTHPTLLLETSLPMRWYLPRDDVRLDLLTPSDADTICAYKGHASYWSYEPAGEAGVDLCWTYTDPLHDALRVKDLVAFWNERIDLVVDGTPVPRPRSFFSRSDPAPRPSG
jgi:uncharacterized protein (DUF427 family)